MIQKWVLVCGFLGIYGLMFCQDNSTYINLYKDIAVAEMMRTGIPASIKLAQGMLESNCGRSDLACKANNHFGIKCGNDWVGDCYKKEDDDYQDGKLVKSCFREFDCVKDSYIAHSDFLTDPAKANRYGFLFKLDPTDYKGWANGLSKAGYATDPNYANRLIDLIEKYQLYKLDTDADGLEASSSTTLKSYRPVHYYNDLKYIVASDNDSPKSLAKLLDISAHQIVHYNDDIHDTKQQLVQGSRVYLQQKRNKYKGRQQYHVMKPGEDLVAISQEYGIKMSALLKRNGLTEGEVPLPNQKLMLKGKLKKELLLTDPYEMPVEKKVNETTDTASKNATIEIPQANNNVHVKETKVDTVYHTAYPSSPKPEHVVAQGETLYRIAQLYGISVEELKKMNNLSADTLAIGQKLVVK